MQNASKLNELLKNSLEMKFQLKLIEHIAQDELT